MSDYEPTPEQVEAAKRVTLGQPEACGCDLPPTHLDDDAALAVLTAAGPLIAAEVRERVARPFREILNGPRMGADDECTISREMLRDALDDAKETLDD